MIPRAVLAPNPSPMTLDGTWTYIIGRERPVVIDPGPAVPEHISAVAKELGGARPAAIVLTHAHADHAAAAPSLAAETGAPVWLAPGGLRSGIDPAAISRWISEVETLETDAGLLEIHLAPGHSPDHVCIRWHPIDGSPPALFVGDLLLGRGDTTFVGSPEGNVADYLHSLDLLESLDCVICYPGHGPPLDSGPGIARHRAHRVRRLERLRSLLLTHPGLDVDKLVDRLYGSALEPALRRAAAASVEAMLVYLRSD